jgi:hypothetical protein
MSRLAPVRGIAARAAHQLPFRKAQPKMPPLRPRGPAVKIPFERTISGAYSFAFRNILSIIGIGWFPYLLLCALVGGVVYQFGPQWQAAFDMFGAKPDPAAFKTIIMTVLPLEAILAPPFIVISAMVTVGIMRRALGQHPGPVLIFFSLGSQVWRLIGSYFLLVLLGIGMVIVMAGGIALAGFALDKFAKTAEMPAIVLLVIAAYLWCVYAVIRVYFFLPAVVVAENHIGIRRSWHLGRGNFWRIVGIFLIVTIPVGLAAQTIESAIFQMSGASFILQPGASPAEMRQFFSTLFEVLKKAWPYFAAVQLLHVIIVSGLMSGAIANAYRFVTGGDEIAPPPAKVPA